MNTNLNPDGALSSNRFENNCYDLDASISTLTVYADDGSSYQLPYAQFLYSEFRVNPVMEKETVAAPEQIRLYFAMAEVTVLGSGLRTLERAIQKYELKFVKSADRRYAATCKTHLVAVAIHLIKEEL